MEGYFNNKSIFTLINKWKKHLIIISIAAIIVGAVISFLITPKFKSFAIVYPSSLSTLSDESETEQMLQIFQSTDVREEIFNSFDLATHYKIESDDPHKLSKLISIFESNISFKKTEFESVNIEVLDEDPQIASNIVDSILVFYNEKVEFLHKSKTKEFLTIKEWEINRKQNELDSLEKHLQEIRNKSGILDYKIQTKQVIKAVAQGHSSNQNTVFIQKLKENGVDYLKTDSLHWLAFGMVNKLKDIAHNLEKDLNKEISYSYVVSSPFPADKKTSPVRWLIVFFTLLSSLFMSIIFIGVIESKK